VFRPEFFAEVLGDALGVGWARGAFALRILSEGMDPPPSLRAHGVDCIVLYVGDNEKDERLRTRDSSNKERRIQEFVKPAIERDR
jgi:hypothetical protein